MAKGAGGTDFEIVGHPANVETIAVISTMANNKSRANFVVCVSNEGCDDLTAWKVYRVMPGAKAAEEDYPRIVDDSGEDYLYPAQPFVEVDVPQAAEDALRLAEKSA